MDEDHFDLRVEFKGDARQLIYPVARLFNRHEGVIRPDEPEPLCVVERFLMRPKVVRVHKAAGLGGRVKADEELHVGRSDGIPGSHVGGEECARAPPVVFRLAIVRPQLVEIEGQQDEQRRQGESTAKGEAARQRGEAARDEEQIDRQGEQDIAVGEEPLPVLKITKSALSEETQVIVLQPAA